jgi:hypothetical protein
VIEADEIVEDGGRHRKAAAACPDVNQFAHLAAPENDDVVLAVSGPEVAPRRDREREDAPRGAVGRFDMATNRIKSRWMSARGSRGSGQSIRSGCKAA